MTDTGMMTGTDTGMMTGTDTGMMMMDGFGDCANNEPDDVCNADEVCLFGPDGVAFCSETMCMDAGDCPTVTSGDAVTTCADLAGDGNTCYIDCAGGETCPDGMVCNADVCAWPLMAPGGGVCPDEDLGNTTPQNLMGDNTGLADDVIPSCTDGGEDSLYLFTAPNDGVYTFDTIGMGTTFDTALFLLDGGCDGPEIACNDDEPDSTQSQIVIALDADQTVVIGVDSFDGGVGAFDLNITEAPLPPDGNCCLPEGQAGCEVMAVEDCVCALDAFCCDTEWDATCVGIAVDDCMADCG